MPKSVDAETGLISLTTEAAIPLLGTRVNAEIAGRGTRVTVAQRFKNTGMNQIEAVYKFPLPDAAAVCGFRAVVADRKIEGRIEDRDEAFKQYDEAMVAGHGAYLLDQERPNIFTLSVGNLKPGQEAAVEIEYFATLPTFGAETRFSLPTTISPRYVPAGAPDEDGIKETDKVNPTFALDVPYGLAVSIYVLGIEGIASVESPSHRVRQEFGEGKIQVEFTSDDVKMDRDFVLNVTRRDGFENRGFAVKSGNDLFLQVDLCPREVGQNSGVEKEVVFVLDCSGSMGGNSIDEARKALSAALGRLDPGSRFNLYRFGSTFEKAFRESVRYNQESLEAARGWVSNAEADLGGTEMLPPLRDIYGEKGKDRRILLITDGQVGNEAQILDLIRDHAAGTRFFTIGIGYGPNEHMLRSAARMGNGACEMITPGERIEHKTLRLFGKLLGESIRDVKLAAQVAALQAPATPVLFTGETNSIFARMPGRGDNALETVTVAGRMDGREVSWEIPVSLIPQGNAPVHILWAREAIRDIEDGAAPSIAAGSRQEGRKSTKAPDAALALSREFGIASYAASFVAVEERPESDKAAGEAVLVKIPVMITRGWHGLDRSFALSQPRFSTSRHAPLSAAPRAYRFMIFNDSVASHGTAPPRMKSAASGPARRTRKAVPGKFQIDTATSTRSQEDARTSLLMDLLACQRAEGGFSLDARGAKALGMSMKSIRDAAKKVTDVRGVDPYVLVCTALVFAYLLGPAADLRETWDAIADKSRKWLAKVTKGTAPNVDGEPIASWAKRAISSTTGK
jgi:Ca-activated chloride channel family protein